MRVLALIVLLALASTPCTALLAGELQITYLSATPDCSSPHEGNFTAGDTVYFFLSLNNTGDEDLINARLLGQEWYASNWGIRGTQTPWSYVDLAINQSIEYCFPLTTMSTALPGLWRGRISFRPFTASWNLDLEDTFYNVTNDAQYEAVTVSTNATGTPTIPLNEETDFSFTFHNQNPDVPFTGLVRFRGNDGNLCRVFFDDDTNERTITIPAGGQHTEVVTTDTYPEPKQCWINPFVYSDSTGERLTFQYYSIYVEGDFSKYRVYQFFTDKSVLSPGEQATIDAEVRNIGSTTWDSDCCEYRFRVRARPPGGSWQDIYDETLPVPSEHAVSQNIWYTGSFTNTLSEVISEYYVYFYAYHQGEQMSWHYPSHVYYSPDNFPDVSGSCTSGQYTTSQGIVLQQNCSANGNQIIFVQPSSTEELSSITASQGSLQLWWEGTSNGNSGYFIRGSTDAEYTIEYLLYKSVELDGFSFTAVVALVAFVSVSVLLGRRVVV
ncbi:MAG: hypothetical protein OXR66_01835 [Candidatus Woesearchaeota archaeon]|nr:hypothetical protein [Candidatus Woesearchaeota archaeon]